MFEMQRINKVCIECGKVYDGFESLRESICNECEEAKREKGKDKQNKIFVLDTTHRIFPKRFKDCSFDNYVIKNDDQQKAFNKVCEYIKNSDIKKSGNNLILSGSIGTGKTHLAIAAIRYTIEHGEKIDHELDYSKYANPYYFKYCTIAEIITDARFAMSYGGNKSSITQYYNYKWLVIDEIGRQTGSDNEQNILFEVLNKRYNNILPTILITNETGDSLKKYLGTALIDRMIETGSVFVNMEWVSYRGRHGKA